MDRIKTTIAPFAVAMALFCAVGSTPVLSQGLNSLMSNQAQSKTGEKDRLLVDAKEIVYNNDKNTISASGDVQLNYQGRSLQADKVIYDRNTGRVYAEGNAKLTDEKGAVMNAARFELTDDFKSGFIDSLRLVQTSVDNGVTVTTRFSSPRAERSEGETTTFERGTYTACEPCKDHPEKPPLWQVRAAKIIHNNSEQTIYYEDATLEILGLPVAYMPYFWTPDPTVKRKTGFLAPNYIVSNSLGYGGSVPFFWAIAPNYDLTLNPTFLSRQGLLAQAEWRHRLETGAYNIRAAGIFQRDGDAFLKSPYGAGDRDFRGSLESAGIFHINERWKWGWDVALLSDKWFLQNYGVKSESINSIYIKESISTLYLQGQGDRSFFDMRGYYFQGLSTTDWQKQQPVVLPVVDYNKRITPSTIGGELSIDVNVTSLSRQAAQYEQVPIPTAALFGLYETCSVFQAGKCLVRGISGTTSRASVNVSWRREFIDPAGQVWTPFAFFKGDAYKVSADFTGYQNAQLSNFFSGNDNVDFRGMPGVGLEYRFPFVGTIGTSGTQTLEPIAQIIARPNETLIGKVPNEDAQSLVFEDTSLFEWNKFTGYDRSEGGVRANVGLQYTVTGANDFYANVLFGQSYQVAGRNSFSKADFVNTGLDSGLDQTQSDYVGRFQISPNRNFSFVTRGRFDHEDFGLNRIETSAIMNFNPYLPISTSLTYARYAAQPEIGFARRREGVSASATWSITPNWSISGSVLLDLDRYLLARDTYAAAYAINPATAVYNRQDSAYITGMSVGLGYVDECTTFSVSYTVSPRDIAVTSGEKDKNQTVMFRLELRTLGEVAFNQNIGTAASNDGVAAQ
ncbi:LPS-assembly protein LptD [Microvirga antarctica]|uniref:LPS-assembly protein LptD n=1 Tax=Microvirga antarctica TaxID=2819233 RepID=UPI001FED1C02|nr:LPS-assembly protein LptD [Microvirga antarctica]